MKKLFTLFGEKAIETKRAIVAGKTIKWIAGSVEGRSTLEACIDEE
jgi:hypothetical protein